MDDEQTLPHSEVDGVLEAAVEADEDPAVARKLALERTRAALFGARASQAKVDRFTLLEELGRGGMGVVFAAYDPQLDRRVAIKLMHLHASAGGDASTKGRRATALAEARAMARVAHPNVVTIFEVGEHDGSEGPALFLAMEFVQGHTLRSWVNETKPTPAQIVEAHVAAARGLAAVHAAGLVHADFKPDNVMISDDGRVRVMDFGLAGVRPGADSAVTADHLDAGTAERVDTLVQVTESGLVGGTPPYMAPERFDGRHREPRSDQFAWAVSLYESLAGRRPYDGLPLPEFYGKLLSDDPVPALPDEVSVEADVRRVIARGLSKDPEQRFVDMDEVIAALTPEPPRRKWWPAVTLGTLAAAGAVMVAGSETPACPDAAAELADTWNDAREAELRDRFARSELPYASSAGDRVVHLVSRYAEAWTHGYAEACAATRIRGEQSEAELERSWACLDRREEALDALLDLVLAADDEALPQASVAAERLTPPSHCSDPGFLDPTAVYGSTDVPAEVRASFEREALELDAALMLGVTPDPAETASLLERAEATADESILARIEHAVAEVDFRRGDLEAVEKRLSSSYAHARRAGRPEIAIAAASGLAEMLATTNPSEASLAAARNWLDVAKVEAEVGGLSLTRRSREVLARIESESGNVQEALAIFEALIAELEEDEDCAPCHDLYDLQRARAREYLTMRDPERAEQVAQQALATALELYDPSHPAAADVRMELGEAQYGLGRFEEAIATLRMVVDARAATYGALHFKTATARSRLARALRRANRLDEAAEQMLLAIDGFEAAGHTMGAAIALDVLADVRKSQERYEDAAEVSARGIELMRRQFPDGHPQQVIALTKHAQRLASAGRHDDAKTVAEEALAYCDEHDEQGVNRLAALTTLGSIRRQANAPDEALQWAEAAIPLSDELDLSYYSITGYMTRARILEQREGKSAALESLGPMLERCEKADEAARVAAYCTTVEKRRDELAR